MPKIEQPNRLGEEEVSRILEAGAPEEVERLRQRFNIAREKMELFQKFAQLRKQIIDQSEKAVGGRKKTNSEMTAEEKELGIYIEFIEPQILDAIRTLRAKGYRTWESGFKNEDSQNISFDKAPIENYIPSQELLDWLHSKNVEIKISPEEISLRFEKYYNTAELREIWNRVAQDLPALADKPIE
ncbi:MAG TPA: hypothetical protein VMX18_04090 [Candidatus Bipolaricaulota bacterium]|nr:hypothetical protein [Candidatus Bipolaricaulota bacterium]